MLCINHPNTNPQFNLAAEEYILRNFNQDVFMLWRNHPAIIVGKHQNTLAEINLDYVKEKKLDVVRRLSGGGAVFHDLGNLNFTFIKNVHQEGNLVDFRKYTEPILQVLKRMGIDARFEGRNDITIDGRKISGNAEHVFKNRVLHHGTLLYSALMSDLSKALKVNPLKYQDKGVKSVRSRVTNIAEHMPEQIDVTEFRDRIFDYIRETHQDATLYDYSEQDLAEITKLVETKYATWDWNFGYSPKYNFEKMVKTNGGHIEFHIHVEKGIMKEVKIYGDFFNMKDISEIEALLKDTPHSEEAIMQKLASLAFDEYFHGVPLSEFVAGMF